MSGLLLKEERLSELSEEAARRLTRGRFLRRAIKGATAATAAISVGSFVGVKNALADPCIDNCTPPGPYCHNCPTNGCPTGCKPWTTSACEANGTPAIGSPVLASARVTSVTNFAGTVTAAETATTRAGAEATASVATVAVPKK